MLRQLQSIAIVGFFGVMMFFLARDHVIPSFNRGSGIEVDRSVLTDTWVDQDEWMTIKVAGTPLGRMRTVAEEELAPPVEGANEGVPESYTSSAHLELGPGLLRGRLLTAASLNRRLELESVRVRAHLPGIGGKLMTPEQLDEEELPAGAYELIGRVVAGEFLYRLKRDSAVQYGSFRLGRPVTVADSITPILRGNMLTRNVVYTVDLFDPLVGNQAGSAEVEWVDSKRETVEDRIENVRQVELRYQGMKTKLFVDQNGTVLRREIPLFAAKKEDSTLTPEVKGASVLFERVSPATARDLMPDLAYMPVPRPIAAADLRGINQGEVIQGVQAFGLLGGSLPGILSQEKGNK